MNVNVKDRILGKAIYDEMRENGDINLAELYKILAAHRESQWQDISTAPENVELLVCGWSYGNPESKERTYSVAMLLDGKWVSELCPIFTPTHWQLLTPPKEG